MLITGLIGIEVKSRGLVCVQAIRACKFVAMCEPAPVDSRSICSVGRRGGIGWNSLGLCKTSRQSVGSWDRLSGFSRYQHDLS